MRGRGGRQNAMYFQVSENWLNIVPQRTKGGQVEVDFLFWHMCYVRSLSEKRHWSNHHVHTLSRALVLPKKSPVLLATILDGLPLWHEILEWLNHPCKLVLILLTSEGWQAESTPPGINSTADKDLKSELEEPKPATLTMKPTPGRHIPPLTKY